MRRSSRAKVIHAFVWIHPIGERYVTTQLRMDPRIREDDDSVDFMD